MPFGEVGKARKRVRWWSLWAKALGEKASHRKGDADAVALIRTLILLSYLTTNAFIIAGVARHWDDGPSSQKFAELHNTADPRQNTNVGCDRRR